MERTLQTLEAELVDISRDRWPYFEAERQELIDLLLDEWLEVSETMQLQQQFIGVVLSAAPGATMSVSGEQVSP